MTFHFSERVTCCDVSGRDVGLELSSGSTLRCDDVLVCAGRASNTADLNLAAAGLTPGGRGVLVVDDHYRTTVNHIYAAGDVVGGPALVSTGMEQARLAVCHAFGVSAKADIAPLQTSGIYTIPEVGMVGATEETLQAEGIDYVVGRADTTATPAAGSSVTRTGC